MKKFSVKLLLVVLAVALAVPSVGYAQKVKIGLSFAGFDIERWPREKDIMVKLGEEAGADVFFQVANNNATLQNSQIENMALQGAKVIIIVAHDGAAAATAVDQAAAEGVKCIAYDRLIPTAKLGAYITFDNVEVGRQEALGVLAVVPKGNFALIGGSPTDNNAHLVRKGQMEVLKPLIDKGDVKVVGDQWVDGWSQEKAVGIMENILTANQNKVDAVVASNDGTGLGSLQALDAQKLAGKVPVSGQDATAAACKSIVDGKFTVTVFKDINLLAPAAIQIAMKLAKGEDPGIDKRPLAELSGKQEAAGEVPCKFLPVVRVTKDNLYDVIIKSGFQKWEEIYKDVPEAQRPPKP
jgi:D-xylose transport system substrate-binding protein